MELSQLYAFVKVANTGSFSTAAKQLGLSQPSLSRQVQQLEAHLGVMLFDRYHRPLALTEAGQFFYQHIDPLLAELEQVAQMTQRVGVSHPNNQLTIGFVASVLYGLLPEIMARLKQRLPDLDIKLVEISSNQQLDALKSGEIDVGFGRFRHEDSFIRQIFLRHERLVVALPAFHALAMRPPDEGIAFHELIDNTLILYHRTPLPDQNAHESDPLLHLFAQHRLKPSHTTKVRDLQIALGLVAAGEGMTLVPDSLKTVRTGQIHYHRLRHENATTPIFMNLLASRHHPLIPTLLQTTYDLYESYGITYSPMPLP